MSQTVSELLVGVLEQIGVRHLFGLIGDSLNPLADAVPHSKIEWVGVRHEEGAALAAAGQAKLTEAVNVKLKENRGMARWPTSRRRLHPLKAHLSQIECIDKHVDHANRVALVNEIIEAFGQQRPLPTIRLFNEAPHQFPRRITRES